MGIRHGWEKESKDVYNEGVYHKINQAIIVKPNKTVVPRNTYTGKEKRLGTGAFPTKAKAREFMLSFVRKYPCGTMPTNKRA